MNTQAINFAPVAYVKNERLIPNDDPWGEVISEITLAPDFPDSSLHGIEMFSHLEILFYFDRLPDELVVRGERHPRERKEYPLTGIFAQRGAARPNKIGATMCKLLEHRGRSLVVKGLDAIDGTPVLDIKPVVKEFLPKEEINQPAWVSDLMKTYW